MRFALVLAASHAVLVSTLVAQQPNKTPAFLFAAGPTWRGEMGGVHVRAEYHILRDNWFGLRIEGGARWTPTQEFSTALGLYYAYGVSQYADVNLGVAAMVTPVPRARIAPYIVLGAAARQMWANSEGYFTFYSTPPYGPAYTSSSGTFGDVSPFLGLGTRVRLNNRIIQIEARTGGAGYDVTIGTSLRF